MSTRTMDATRRPKRTAESGIHRRVKCLSVFENGRLVDA